jgi:hypothetical protein
MPANTSPDNIVYPVSSDPIAPLNVVFQDLANSVQSAIGGISTGWTTWTPTFTNITIGNGLAAGRYKRIGKTVFFWARLNFGTTTSITGAPTVLLPSTSTNANSVFANVILTDSGVRIYTGGSINTTTSCSIRYSVVISSIVSIAAISSTLPHTWGDSDSIVVQGFYEEA